MQKVFSSSSLMLAVFAALALLLFWPAREAGFITDWLGGQENYERGTLNDALHNFGWGAILPVLFVVNFGLFKIFDTHWLPWFVIFLGFHVHNAWQLYRFSRRLLPASETTDWVAVLAGALFLLSPYTAEPIIWKACIHYQMSLSLFWLAAHQVLHFLEKPALHRALWANGLFLTAIYLTEWNIVWPVLFAGLLLLYAMPLFLKENARLMSAEAAKKAVFQIIAPQMALLAGWFGLNKFYLGNWVGHYGATHLNTDPQLLLSRTLQYSIKYIGFSRYWPHPLKSKVFDFAEKPFVAWLFGACLLAFFVWWAFYHKKMAPRLRVAGYALGAYLVALLPIANLSFNYLQWSENDRYGYYASGFFWLFCCLLLAGLPSGLFKRMGLVLVGLSAILLFKMTRLWGETERIYDSLAADFRWYDREEVIVVASADNLNGVHIMRIIGQQSGFDEALALRRREPFKGRMWEVVQFNMETPDDGVKVEPMAEDSTGQTYKISFPQHGNWFWRNGIGADNYSTDRYTFRKKEWHAELTLKNGRQNATLIYPLGDKWVEVK